jgi:prephenate dehydrogenase
MAETRKIGVLGGGQLGRMMIEAAHCMGKKTVTKRGREREREGSRSHKDFSLFVRSFVLQGLQSFRLIRLAKSPPLDK